MQKRLTLDDHDAWELMFLLRDADLHLSDAGKSKVAERCRYWHDIMLEALEDEDDGIES